MFTWIPTKRIQARIQSTEIVLLRKTKVYTKLGHIINEDIRSELAIHCIKKKESRHEDKKHFGERLFKNTNIINVCIN